MSPQTKVKDTFLEWEPVYYGQNFYFRIKLKKNIPLVYVMIKLIKWDGTLSDEANVLLLYIYIYIYHVKIIIFQLNCRIHSASSMCIELFTELYAAIIQRCRQMSDFKKKKRGDLKQFNGIKLLNLSKDVLDYMSFLVYTLMYMYMIHVYMHLIKLLSVHSDK